VQIHQRFPAGGAVEDLAGPAFQGVVDANHGVIGYLHSTVSRHEGWSLVMKKGGFVMRYGVGLVRNSTIPKSGIAIATLP
jgi:hypothetical protein